MNKQTKKCKKCGKKTMILERCKKCGKKTIVTNQGLCYDCLDVERNHC